MKLFRPFLFALMITCLLVTGGENTPGAASTQSPNGLVQSAGANTAWFTDYIAVGDQASLALTPSGLPLISYFDAQNRDLLLARPASSGSGNCGFNNGWDCEVLDSVGDVGRYNSVAFYRAVHFDIIGIAYLNLTSGDLKYLKMTCTSGGCTISSETVESNGMFFNGWKGISLKFDSEGDPHIAYHAARRDFLEIGELRYAYRVGAGGNCLGNDAWQCEVVDKVVDSDDYKGEYPSLALNANDQPRISYGERDGTYYRLWFAERHPNPVPGNCDPASDYWSCKYVYPFGGMHTSLMITLDPSTGIETSHIASYSPDSATVVYAHDNYDDVSCAMMVGYPNGWECVDIAPIWPHANEYPQLGISMAADERGIPIIAYADASDPAAPMKLMLARPTSAYGSMLGGNCGPQISPPLNWHTWVCTTLDSSGLHSNDGTYASLAISPSGLAAVAYYEEDIPNAIGYLKFAYQRFQTFLPLIDR